MSPAVYIGPAVTFASRGYAVVSIMRRGFGRSDGPYAEGYGGPCGDRDYLRVARISAEDVLGAVAALRAESWVDPDRMVLLGQSTGGLAVTAAAAATPPGVVGVLDFAGGRGSDAPDHVCDEDHLVGAFGELGKTARTPALWIFAENDHFFRPDLAHRMLDAYHTGGAPAQLVMLPPVGVDGHYALAIAPPELIWPPIEKFLASLKLPTKIVVDLPPMPSLPPPPGVNSGCAAGFRSYLDARVEAKAFATNPSGHCGWDVAGPTVEMAEQAALDSCAQRGANCTLYAVGQSLVAP
jgi:dienelactone hydrolase